MSNSNNDILVVSLDIHKKVHYVHCELKSSAKIIGKDFSFPNSATGFNTFFSEVENRLSHTSVHSIAIVLEATGPYWKPIGYAIINKGWPIYIVSPEQVYHQRIADDPAASKLNKFDPKTIAKLFRDGKASLARSALPSSALRQLRLKRSFFFFDTLLMMISLPIISCLSAPSFHFYILRLYDKKTWGNSLVFPQQFSFSKIFKY